MVLTFGTGSPVPAHPRSHWFSLLPLLVPVSQSAVAGGYGHSEGGWVGLCMVRTLLPGQRSCAVRIGVTLTSLSSSCYPARSGIITHEFISQHTEEM